MTAPARPRGNPIRVLVAVGLIALAALGVAFFPLARWTLALVSWIRGGGVVGVGAFAIAYVAATALALPGSLLTMGAGFVYGPVVGTCIVSPISTLGATVSFVIARFVARDSIARKVTGDRRFSAIDKAVGENGFKIVALLRLSPVLPFNLLNYALGLTRVKLRDYALASWLGMLPGTALFVYIGSLVTNVTQLVGGSRPSAGGLSTAFYWAGLVATLLATAIVTRIARRALSDVMSHTGDSSEQST